MSFRQRIKVSSNFRLYQYECFIENKNVIKTFWNYKPSKNNKEHQALPNNYLFFQTSIEALDEFQDL